MSLTTGGPEAAYLPDGFNGDIHGILRPIHRGILQFVGFDVLVPQIVYGPAHLQEAERHAALQCYRRRLASIRDEAPFDVGRY